jgi:uncharacterized damage-inducible protein DinB
MTENHPSSTPMTTSSQPAPDLRYPIGKLARKSVLTAEERTSAIDAIAATPTKLSDAVSRLDDAQLDTPYRPDGWTVRQLVHHVADSHINAYLRFRFALTEDNPTIKPYQEAVWAELPDARTLPVDVSLTLLRGLHERWATLLRAVPVESFARTMQHPENGSMTLDALLTMYAWHGRHHTAHVTALRERMGWS